MPWDPVHNNHPSALKGAPELYPMPQSLAKIYTHLVFSTKHRESWLTDDLRDAPFLCARSGFLGFFGLLRTSPCSRAINRDGG